MTTSLTSLPVRVCMKRGLGEGEEGNISECLVHLLQREGIGGRSLYLLIPFQTNVRFSGKQSRFRFAKVPFECNKLLLLH